MALPPIEQADQDRTVWSYIPTQQFSAPSEPATEAVLGGIRAILAQIWPWKSDGNLDPALSPPQLRTAPIDLLNRFVPAPDWRSHAQNALGKALCSWVANPSKQATNQLVISAPFCNGAQTVTQWAHKHDLQIVDPPTEQQILDQDTSWLKQWTNRGDRPVVLPNLERTFLRHQRGLFLVRQLFEKHADSSSPFLFGCQSWAWAFLQKSCPVNVPNLQSWTLAPLDIEPLVTWIVDELTETGLASHVTFRRTDSGKLAIDLEDMSERANGAMNLFGQISARSRGNPAVAWSLWRQSLSIAADENVNKEAQAEARQDNKRTIWVRSWDMLNLPLVPTELPTEGLHILQALLVHDGLPEPLILALIPGHRVTISRMIAHLDQLRLIRLSDDGRWRSNDIAYPAIRQRLHLDGYLVDSL